jgi:alcohol dehydrogenase
MIAPFRNHLPVKIRFGDGVAGDLADVVASEGASRPFVIMDEGLDGFIPGVAAALDGLPGAIRFEKPAGEPTVALVEQAAAALAESRADAVIAIGGGSSMDTAKAARLVAGQGGPYLRFAAGGVEYEHPSLPLVCVPTTAGTGSEVSGGAVITDEATHVKAGIASPLLRAQHALVDPVLTHGLPAKLTAYTGIDALAQAIAGLVVTARTPLGDAVGLESTRLAGRSLVRCVRDGSDADARSDMACASLLAGLAMNISDCGSEHSLGQALGGEFGLPHGLTIGLVLAETMDRDRRYVPEQFERVADALDEPEDGSGDGSRAVRAVRRILEELEFETLESVGVREEHPPGLAEKALADYFISVAPSPWSTDEVVDAYRAGLALGASR